MTPDTFRPHLLHPRYLPSWLGLALWWSFCQLFPLSTQIWMGKQIGRMLARGNSSRKRIAQRNIELCYPEFNAQQQQLLVRRTLEETAIGIFESGCAWFWPNWRFRKRYTIKGMEFIEQARKSNKGVLFLGVHFTTIEIGASMVNLEFPISGFYRPHNNAVYEWAQAAGRVRRNAGSTVVPNGDVRGIIKALRNGAIINYAPDQDYGLRRSVFAPFFGIDTATVKAPAQLASAGRAEVLTWVTRRDSKTNHYTIEIGNSLSGKLGQDEKEDAKLINQFVEQEVRKNTEQYLWVHRRFKTRPPGETSLY
ncbi:LpxL/LpxP family Kdo(2)-lipid IV(A) lauroyl/palmitoleoyl acyltransferase [Agaribacterium sp. ZY112]|uniref:LpxL/LpxP family Kdo(2)-lipid IV(A) lauroyl/palmitoleoyl acyltransferase n=1 Tax=Agaribacterium sp. ZY112 TaxID=3233574 RepID=UPI003524827F